MYTLITISLILSAYSIAEVLYFLRKQRNKPRSFQLSIHPIKSKDDFERVEISFYVLHLSYARIFLEQSFKGKVALLDRINIEEHINKDRQIRCDSLGDSLTIQLLKGFLAKEVEQGESLSLDILSLSESRKNEVLIREHLIGSGWKIDDRMSVGIDGYFFYKNDLRVYLNYLT